MIMIKNRRLKLYDMPNNVDFSKIKNKKFLTIYELEGWKNPLIIEYGIDLFDGLPSFYWKIKDTKHTFIIPVKQMEFLSKGNYEKHFKEVLQKFREDYIEWGEEYDFEADWMQEYRDQYSRFINI